MKSSMLELTQIVLSSLGSDEVDSISDTAEARQVAQIIRQCYFNILTRANLTEHQQIFSLLGSADTTLPVLMHRPDSCARFDWIKYNKADTGMDPDYEYVTILPLQQFLDMTHQFALSETFVDSLTYDGHTYLFRNDKQPDFCTVLQDNFVIFDSYKNSVETTLQESKNISFGLIMPSLDLSDSTIPDLDELQFPLLLNEAKSMAAMELKEMPNQTAVLESRRQWRSLQRTKELHNPSAFDKLPNFGRWGRR